MGARTSREYSWVNPPSMVANGPEYGRLNGKGQSVCVAPMTQVNGKYQIDLSNYFTPTSATIPDKTILMSVLINGTPRKVTAQVGNTPGVFLIPSVIGTEALKTVCLTPGITRVYYIN